ncbi:asparagine synthase-related protein [Mycobacterium sp.]|uniref:asparagine synthase-related protein n=1 Tax=Mycobacterium sp. TaxID=1785 RepID=UPI002B874077|nr:asparagine synthase-related protein [Mycobacterium sp.]HTQ21816.1 asparagine synthase-related protein [Mycobacterium sp.]
MTAEADHRFQPANQGFAGWVDMSAPTRLAGGVDCGVMGCRVWWRGFLANRSTLLTELGVAAEPSCPDERLVAEAYQRWGATVQAHLLGEYALCVLDQTTGVLVLTHDALGVVPLYYSARGHTIYFGTHLSLLARLIPGLDVDEGYIAEFLLRGECLDGRTIYRHVNRLGVGRTRRYRARRGTELATWWLGEVPELCYRDIRDYDEQFRQLLRSAVATAADGRTWSELSGGLDSSSIACTAHHLGLQDFATVSVIYPTSTTSDESSWIEIVHADKGIRTHLIDGDKHKPLSALPDRRIEEPSRLHTMWPIFQQYETILRAYGVDVLLSGLGGDQVLFGETDFPIHVADYVRRARLVTAVRQVAQWGPSASERSLTHRVLTGAAVPALCYLRGHAIRYKPDRAVQQRCSWVSADLLHRTGAGGDVGAPGPRMPTVRGQAYYEHLWRLAGSAGQHWAQNTTTYRWRHPLLYRPLVEFMYSLPWQQQAIPGHDRALQRRALAGILPDQIRTRRTKAGPNQAFYEGLRANRDIVTLLIARPLIVQRGYVDQTSWRAAVAAAQFGHEQSAAAFEAAVSLEVWLRQQESPP